jgi:hypothetical protein
MLKNLDEAEKTDHDGKANILWKAFKGEWEIQIMLQCNSFWEKF